MRKPTIKITVSKTGRSRFYDPNSTNPKKNPEARRTRPSYPAFQVGGSQRVAREECGENREVLTAEQIQKGAEPTILLGEFIFRRPRATPGSRSKYAPHVGHKQRLRDLYATMALTA